MSERNIHLVLGAGLLGKAIVKELLKQGKKVRVFDIRPYDHPNTDNVQGDLTVAADLDKAFQNVEVVYHNASVIDWNPNGSPLLEKVNVQGTQNVIDACVRNGVPKLVYTSSMDVVYGGKPIKNGDESLPYPEHHLDPYSESKTKAEKLVLKANGRKDGEVELTTCSLRVTGIYGEHDTVKYPIIMQTYRDGKMRRMGSGKSLFSNLYAGNAAHAHILAAESLTPNSVAAGNSYFLTDHEPQNFFDIIEEMGDRLGYKMPKGKVPYWLIITIAVIGETIAKWTKAKKPPLLTIYGAKATCLDLYFNHDKITKDLGYQPIYTYEEGLNNTINWLREAGWANKK
ncbi:MAG: NAD-dependent epimerase/dehydratase family protein [Chitinophagales bacterium]